jgi:hypothetical protein
MRTPSKGVDKGIETSRNLAIKVMAGAPRPGNEFISAGSTTNTSYSYFVELDHVGSRRVEYELTSFGSNIY